MKNKGERERIRLFGIRKEFTGTLKAIGKLKKCLTTGRKKHASVHNVSLATYWSLVGKEPDSGLTPGTPGTRLAVAFYRDTAVLL